MLYQEVELHRPGPLAGTFSAPEAFVGLPSALFNIANIINITNIINIVNIVNIICIKSKVSPTKPSFGAPV